MKILTLLGCCTLFLWMHAASAQTADNRLSISVGGGPIDHVSNVGNGFSLKKGNSWHGAGLVQLGSYINPSLDLLFFGAVGDLGMVRLKSIGLALKYKFADGKLLSETSTIKPYIYLGSSFNNLSDRVRLKYVPDGNYMSLNAGLGARYYFTQRIHLAYNVAFGYLIAESSEFKEKGRNQEAFINNAVVIGIDLL